MKFKIPDELIFMKNNKLPQKKSEASMEGKLCIISGSTSGVGLETLKQVVKGKADVVMVCRNLEKAEKIRTKLLKENNVNIDIIVADFSKLDDVRKAAKIILDKYKKIDVLINSVGIHSTKKLYTNEGYELVFTVNHLSTFLFTMLLLDRIKENAPARIIQVNSEGHRFNGLRVKDINWHRRIYTGLRGYGASKTAQLLTVWELADQLKDSGVTINAVHPGAVKTNIGNQNGWLYRWFLHHVTWKFLKDPVVSGESIYYLAADPEMENVSGKFFNLTIEEKPAKHALNREKGKKVWDLSMDMVGLKKA